MPSPFPGMDPYLEDPWRWPGVHLQLIAGAQEFLNARLLPKYYAHVEERVYISDEDDPGRAVLVPDLRIARRAIGAPGPPSGGAVALDVTEPIVATTLIEDDIHEPRLEIIDRADRGVVAVIEIVSPSNKAPGSKGRESFRQKRREVMSSPSHWVEIDLLRAGHSLAVRKNLAPHEYLVHVSPADRRPKGLLWPIRLSDRLPTISIPLRPGDADILLDLQAVLDASYGRARYDADIDYGRDPVPPLSPEWAAWADELLKGKGLR